MRQEAHKQNLLIIGRQGGRCEVIAIHQNKRERLSLCGWDEFSSVLPLFFRCHQHPIKIPERCPVMLNSVQAPEKMLKTCCDAPSLLEVDVIVEPLLHVGANDSR